MFYVLGKQYNKFDNISVNVGENEPLEEIFNRHHQLILQELKDQIAEYKNQINSL